MSFLGTILPEGRKVPAVIKQDRMRKCTNCPHFVKLTGSCGPFLVGKQITHNGFPANLCGCIMNEKTELAGAHCPTNQWREYTK